MDKKRKDKIMGLIGVYLVLFIFIVFNITNHYKFFILSYKLDGFILFCLGIVGLYMAKKYLEQLFGQK